MTMIMMMKLSRLTIESSAVETALFVRISRSHTNWKIGDKENFEVNDNGEDTDGVVKTRSKLDISSSAHSYPLWQRRLLGEIENLLLR